MLPPQTNVDVKRQAHGVLQAFRFQLMQSTLAWIGLAPGQVLLAEHVEDFDVMSDTRVSATQAKFSGQTKSVTLASIDAGKALNRFWEQNADADHVSLVYQTNLNAGVERGFEFPEGSSGIAYWEAVRRGAPVGPLREGLIELLPDGALKSWLTNETSESVIREKLVRRVIWSVGLPSGPALSAMLAEQVAGRLAALNLPPGLAGVITRQLTDQVFEQSSDKDPALRRFDSEGLNRFLSHSALGAAAALQGWALPGWAALTDTLTEPGFCAPRTDLVRQLATVADEQQIVWLHGGSGSGKTTLAGQIARQSANPWLLVEFRDLTEPQDALLRLSRTYTDVTLGPPLQGVIIDDIDSDLVSANTSRFGRFLDWARARGLRVILTSSRQCPPATASALGLQTGGVVAADYLELADVKDIVADAGAPSDSAEAWAFLVHTATRAGHPQLVAAKVASLAQRGWPDAAFAEDIIGPPSEALELTRAEARRRLFGDATEAGRMLLKRLACVRVKFDRRLAISAAALDPRILDASASLDFLTGPWIEASPGQSGYLRLSPLLSGLEEDVPAEEIEATRVEAAVEMFRRGPLDRERLGIAFWNSVAAKHGGILFHLHQAFLSLSEEEFRAVAQDLSPITLFPTTAPPFADEPIASMTVRLIQLEVAAAIGRNEVFIASTTAALAEAARLDHEELHQNFATMALMKALFARGTRVPWRVRFEWLAAFERLSVAFPHLVSEDQSATLLQMRRDISPDITLAGFFITIGAQTIQSVDDLADLFDSLSGMTADVRASRLQQLKIFHRGYGIYVQQGWANAWFAGTLDPQSALSAYAQLEKQAAAWGDIDLASECVVAQTILLDEHLKQPDAAIDLIDRALAASTGNAILLRQMAKLLGHVDRYEEAAEILETLSDTIAAQSPIERMYALKEAAVAAGNTGKATKAAALFEQAAGAIAGETDNKLMCHRLALQAECALSCWRAGATREGLSRLAAVLYGLDAIDVESSDSAFMVHERVRAAVGWIDQDASRPLKLPFTLKTGATSAIDIDMSTIDRSARYPLNDVRLLLHTVAVRAGHPDLFPVLNLNSVHPVFVSGLRGAELDAAIATRDVAHIAPAAVALADAMEALVLHQNPQATLSPYSILRWVISGLGVWRYADGETSDQWWDDLVTSCASSPSGAVTALDDLKAQTARIQVAGDTPGNVMHALRQRPTDGGTPQEKRNLHLLLVEAAMGSADTYTVPRALTRFVRDDWSSIFDRQRFLLTQPQRAHAMFEQAATLIETRIPGGLTAMMTMAAFAVGEANDLRVTGICNRLGGALATEG